ncbi:MAG: ABC transporter substrate-binding protein, partial [Rubrimonas sp.]
PVGTVADLRGRSVGFAVAGVQEALLDAMLDHAGVAADEVRTVAIGWSISPALMAGQVDAVIGAFRNFELHQLEIEGRAGRCFNPEDHGAPSYEELVFVANPERLDMDAAARFLAAVGRATEWLRANPEQGWAIFAATAAELDTELNRRAWADTLPLFAADPAALDAARYAAFEAFLAERGLTPGGLTVEQLAVVPGADG